MLLSYEDGRLASATVANFLSCAKEVIQVIQFICSSVSLIEVADLIDLMYLIDFVQRVE